MAASGPVAIPWPLSSFPGSDPQESMGRLFNCHVEPLGEDGGGFKWVRTAGLSLHAATSQSGYRGGLVVNNTSYECWSGTALEVDAAGASALIGSGLFPGTAAVSIARNQASPSADVVAVDPNEGAYVLASAAVVAATATATIGGGTYNSGDIVSLTFLNPLLEDFPVSVSYTLGSGENPTTIGDSLAALINGNATLGTEHLTAANVAGVLTVSHQGNIGNNTTIVYGVTGGTETVTLDPASGNLTGGQGTYGAFTGGNPTAYSGGGVMPQPNSVCFQDGYFFFTTADGEMFATGINSLSMSGLSKVIVQAKADVTLLRGVAFSGVLLAFTTGSCEVWQDAANPAPIFPYSRVAVLEFGLLQSAAIAGWETGFSELLWVAQDFGVHWMTAGGLSQIKVSPPDLDRLIEAEIRAGGTLEAGCYIVAGKKFWVLSSASWTWEFNLQTKKWNERQSLTDSGFGRWRGVGGHPAFGKWLVGDAQSGNLLFVDDQNPTDVGAVQLFHLESAPVKKFPMQQRIVRADFDFVVGVGKAVGDVSVAIVDVFSYITSAIRIAVTSTARMKTGDTVKISGVEGATEANGTWTITVLDAIQIELQGSTLVNAYTAGGTILDVTSPPDAVSPTVAIYMSKDGGVNWGNPLIRSLGEQKKAQRTRVTVTNMGLSGAMGVRWRLEVSSPVYVSLLGATMSSEMRVIGP